MHLFPYFTYKTVMKFIKDIDLIGIKKTSLFTFNSR